MSGYYPPGCSQSDFDAAWNELGDCVPDDDEPNTEDAPCPITKCTVTVEPHYTKNTDGTWHTGWNASIEFDNTSEQDKTCRTRSEAERFIGETIMTRAENDNA